MVIVVIRITGKSEIPVDETGENFHAVNATGQTTLRKLITPCTNLPTALNDINPRGQRRGYKQAGFLKRDLLPPA
jgi:hypothetical protein